MQRFGAALQLSDHFERIDIGESALDQNQIRLPVDDLFLHIQAVGNSQPGITGRSQHLDTCNGRVRIATCDNNVRHTGHGILSNRLDRGLTFLASRQTIAEACGFARAKRTFTYWSVNIGRFAVTV
jgi:hypothetical protein